MKIVDKVDGVGRWHRVIQDGDHEILVGPADEIVDGMNLPPEFATRLHNALFQRGILNYADASRNFAEMQGALQETLLLDVQRLHEAYYKYEHQSGGLNG